MTDALELAIHCALDLAGGKKETITRRHDGKEEENGHARADRRDAAGHCARPAAAAADLVALGLVGGLGVLHQLRAQLRLQPAGGGTAQPRPDQGAGSDLPAGEHAAMGPQADAPAGRGGRVDGDRGRAG